MKKLFNGILIGLLFGLSLLLFLYIVISFAMWQLLPIDDGIAFIMRGILIVSIFAGIAVAYDEEKQ